MEKLSLTPECYGAHINLNFICQVIHFEVMEVKNSWLLKMPLLLFLVCCCMTSISAKDTWKLSKGHISRRLDWSLNLVLLDDTQTFSNMHIMCFWLGKFPLLLYLDGCYCNEDYYYTLLYRFSATKFSSITFPLLP